MNKEEWNMTLLCFVCTTVVIESETATAFHL